MHECRKNFLNQFFYVIKTFSLNTEPKTDDADEKLKVETTDAKTHDEHLH
jgi:hypothetical protein